MRHPTSTTPPAAMPMMAGVPSPDEVAVCEDVVGTVQFVAPVAPPVPQPMGQLVHT
jgi:hypothetical protein